VRECHNHSDAGILNGRRAGRSTRLSVALLCLACAPAAARQLQPEYTRIGESGPGGIFNISESAGGRFLLYFGEHGGRIFDRRTNMDTVFMAGDGEYRWSPDGRAVSLNKADEAGRNRYVWVMPADARVGRPTGPPQRVSVSPGRGAAFSPDGRSIAFSVIPATDTAAPRIAIVPASGGPEHVVFRSPGWVQQIAWTPDARWLYFRYQWPDAGRWLTAVARVPAAGGTPEVLQEVFDFIGVSPDGRHLALIAPETGEDPEHAIVAITDLEGKEVGRFRTRRGIRPVGWSRTGLKLLASSNRVPRRVELLAADGTRFLRISDPDGIATAPSWSPEGSHIAFSSFEDDRWHLMLASAGGGTPRRLRAIAAPLEGAPVWSPDGRHVAFTSGAERALYGVDVAAGAESRLATRTAAAPIAWNSASTALLYVVQRGETYELRRVSLSGNDEMLRPLGVQLAHEPSFTFLGDSAVVVATAAGIHVAPVRDTVFRRVYVPGPRGYLYRHGVFASADGQWLAVATSRETADRTGEDVIELVSLTGRPTVALPIVSIDPAGPFRWHPDGRNLVVVGMTAIGSLRVLLVPLNGDEVRDLTAAVRSTDPAHFAVSPDGSSLAFSAAGDVDGTLWEIDLERTLGALDATRDGRGPRPRLQR
jgi:Tol biopolymer transport system component